jgi:hypothetical protein
MQVFMLVFSLETTTQKIDSKIDSILDCLESSITKFNNYQIICSRVTVISRTLIFIYQYIGISFNMSCVNAPNDTNVEVTKLMKHKNLIITKKIFFPTY